MRNILPGMREIQLNETDDKKLLGPIIRHSTIAEEVAERLVLAIANGEQPTGARLTEGGVAEIMQVSRVPAREALLSLEEKGILVPAGQRGLKVADFSEKTIQEVRELRYALETVGMLKASKKLHKFPQSISAVDDVLAQMALLSKRPNALAQAQCDVKFHQELMSLSENELLFRSWRRLSPHLLVVFCKEWHATQNKVGELDSHRFLRDTVVNGCPDAIDQALRQHISVQITWRD